MSMLRIPNYINRTQAGMNLWFSEMLEKGFLFHPDDSPEDIVSIETGDPIFSCAEIIKLKEIVTLMFEDFKDGVYEAAYPCFMKSFGIQG